MKTKIIGIPGWKNPTGDYFGAGINHLEFISNFGKAEIIMPWETKADIDLLYLPGGLDLSPDAYDEVPGFSTSNQDVMKEFFYRNRLKNYVEDTPIFGVCLGMQMLGAYFGSKLTQNLILHEQSEDRWETAHSVYLVSGDEEDEEIEVNSHHHQCIMTSDLSNDLSVLSYAFHEEPLISETEMIIEAFKHKTLPIVGVQWHPEELYDSFSTELMEKLLSGRDI